MIRCWLPDKVFFERKGGGGECEWTSQIQLKENNSKPFLSSLWKISECEEQWKLSKSARKTGKKWKENQEKLLDA